MTDFEKLGLFYLGRRHDLATGVTAADPILYDSRDLLTHGVCVGMTGSGKTGLCVSLIEEAAIDGVPVIAIDPKGDLGNLLLTFPRLAADDFRRWIDEDEARRAGVSADAYAAAEAEKWKRGLAEWGQDGQRIERLRAAADFAIYTPGSRAGLPVSILRSFAAPAAGVAADSEGMAERAGGTATSLLDLAGATSAPRSREHTLVAALLTTAWRQGRDLDLPALIQQIQTPPFDRIGVADLESFFPSRDRFELAMAVNGLLAAPGFEQWLEGEALDPATVLYTPEGKPRVAIFSIAHLSDGERMFFVSLLLNQVVAWMRGQPGTSSLRALIYMDEIAGYFPPVANPPSKLPLLTLLKQGRAFGVGVLLATQNPVDLDYKGLSNAGTWFLGRLQTERDKARVLDGLEGAAAGSLARDEADRILSALGKRQFLLHNVHDAAPIVFQTRWALSYLRGPLTREQIRALMDPRRPKPAAPRPAAAPAAPAPAAPPSPAAASKRSAADAPGTATARIVPPSIQQYVVPAAGAGQAGETYVPVVLGAARVHFTDAKMKLDATRDVMYAARLTDDPVPMDWARSVRLDISVEDLQRVSDVNPASFTALPAAAAQPKNYAAWEKAFARWVGQAERLESLRHPTLKIASQSDESERDFRIRVQNEGRAARDAAVDAVRRKYAARAAGFAERLRRAEAAVGREQEEASQQKTQTAVSLGATMLGALFGRKAVSTGTLGRATTAARGVSRSMKEAADVKRATETVEAVRGQMRELEDQMAADAAAVAAQFDVSAPLERMVVAPKRGQVDVRVVALGWMPASAAPSGEGK
jgi:hypothetical protein